MSMTSQQRWYWALANINNKISLFVQSAYSCKICAWSLRFHQFGAYQVNTVQSSTLLYSCLVNKWPKCDRDIVIFVLRHFLGSPCRGQVWRGYNQVSISANLQKRVAWSNCLKITGINDICCGANAGALDDIIWILECPEKPFSASAYGIAPYQTLY